MNTPLKSVLIGFGILFWTSAYSLVHAASYYVSPTGNNTNPGTISQPFATLQKAHDVANPGDTIYMRGGTYMLSAPTTISRSGSSGNLIKISNYPDEVPIIDGISLTNSGWPGIQMNSASWWHFQGLEIKNAPMHGIYLNGASSNNIVEHCNLHHNVRLNTNGAGVLVTGTSGNNLILNNDAHHNGLFGSTGGDGVSVTDTKATGNVLRGNRVWRNNDDGIDLWNAANVLVENNWSWENGYDDNFVTHGGNGTGFKLGGGGTGDGNHIVRNNVAWRNTHNGFDDNSADIPMVLYNNTGYENGRIAGTNFAFYTGIANVLKNNLAFTPNTVSFNGAVQHTFNSWNVAATVSLADFVTLDFAANLGARQADGSLPVSNFLRLATGSDLVDKGVNVGIAYTGSVPDLGAYEYVNPVLTPQPPSNLVVR